MELQVWVSPRPKWEQNLGFVEMVATCTSLAADIGFPKDDKKITHNEVLRDEGVLWYHI